MAHFTKSGLQVSERPHSPYECDEVECEDCFENVADADEDYCRVCGDPLCSECAQILAEETLCRKCFAKSQAAAIESLQTDPEIGDLFHLPKAA